MPPELKPNWLGVILWILPTLIAAFGLTFAEFGPLTLGFALLLIICLRHIFTHVWNFE